MSTSSSLLSPSTLWILQSNHSLMRAKALGRLLLLGIKRNPMSFINKDDELSKCISKCLSNNLDEMDDELVTNTR